MKKSLKLLKDDLDFFFFLNKVFKDLLILLVYLFNKRKKFYKESETDFIYKKKRNYP